MQTAARRWAWQVLTSQLWPAACTCCALGAARLWRPAWRAGSTILQHTGARCWRESLQGPCKCVLGKGRMHAAAADQTATAAAVWGWPGMTDAYCRNISFARQLLGGTFWDTGA